MTEARTGCERLATYLADIGLNIAHATNIAEDLGDEEIGVYLREAYDALGNAHELLLKKYY